MPKGKIEIQRLEDHVPRAGAYLITKTHGKLTLHEIKDAMKDLGAYAILEHNDPDRSYAGWGDEEEDPGDSVIAYCITEGEPCPLCAQMSPLMDYCPECGHPLRTVG